MALIKHPDTNPTPPTPDLGLGALHDLIRHLVPGGVQAGLGVHQILGHHLGSLAPTTAQGTPQ